MRPLPAYLRENFKSFFFVWGLRKKFLLEDIVNIRNECLTFLHSWEMKLGEVVTYLPRTASRFTGFVTCLTLVHFPRTQKKDTYKMYSLIACQKEETELTLAISWMQNSWWQLHPTRKTSKITQGIHSSLIKPERTRKSYDEIQFSVSYLSGVSESIVFILHNSKGFVAMPY